MGSGPAFALDRRRRHQDGVPGNAPASGLGDDPAPFRCHHYRKGPATVYDDIHQGEILWITPDVYRLPELPDGFALRVDGFLGRDYDSPAHDRVWVHGTVLMTHVARRWAGSTCASP
jgi:hypothetical protein